jgi:hypothetical protein
MLFVLFNWQIDITLQICPWEINNMYIDGWLSKENFTSHPYN